MAKNKANDATTLIGRTVNVELRDRAESEFTGVELAELNERGATVSWLSRGSFNLLWIPTSNISFISFKAGVEAEEEAVATEA